MQSLTRLGGGLHCATWNTLEHGHQNAKYFFPSKRHPFNPFDENAFTEERLRAVLEHDLKRRLQDAEWNAINNPFTEYWNGLWHSDKGFEPNDMYDAIKKDLEVNDSNYFRSEKALKNAVNILVTYMMHVPRLILPDNTEYNPKAEYIPSKIMLVHFKDTTARLTAFSVSFEHQMKEVYDELEFTKQVEEEAQEAAERKDGTVYVLYYRSYDKRRVCPYRYTFITSDGWKSHVRIIMYWEAPDVYDTLADYAEKAISKINFFDNYRKGDCNFDEKSDLPF